MSLGASGPVRGGVLAALAAIAALLSGAPPAEAWGPVGHRAVGLLAERHLSPRTAAAVRALMGRESLARSSTWADFVRADPDWAHADPWHYVDIPDGLTYARAPRNPAGDLLTALERFERVLRDRSAPLPERQVALRFVVHFVGDLHQPLHVGRPGDRGGNEIAVTLFGEPTNLHRVWDSGLIDAERLSFTELAEFLDVVSPAEARAWQRGTYLDWAAESMALRPLVYDLDGGRLSGAYRYRAWPVIERRLLQAGIRLAAVLERALVP